MFWRSRSPSSATAATLTSCEAMSVLVFRSGELAHDVFRVRCAHKSFANKDGIDADALQLLDLRTAADTRFGHDRLAGRDGGQQVDGRLDVDREVLEVAVVDPDHVHVELEGDFELLL